MSSSDSLPLPGVGVRLRGDHLVGTISNKKGEFEISAKEMDTLFFSFVGFEDFWQVVGRQARFEIKMKEITTRLKEVVVTAVGIKKYKNYLTHSFDHIDIESQNTNGGVNILDKLSAQVPGVFTNSVSGSPGAALTVRIRGNSSFFSNNSPLVVLDGVPIDNSTTLFSDDSAEGVDASNRLIDINSLDIKEIVVLKGPSALVLYGSRAANGALIITTKKGKEGPFSVNYSTRVIMSHVNRLPDLQDQYAQGRPINGIPEWQGPDRNERYSWGPRIADLEFDGTTYPYDRSGRLVPTGQGNGVPAKAYNNLQNFFDKGLRMENQINLTGGNSEINYYFSASSMTDAGVIPKSNFRRTSLKGSLNMEIGSHVTSGFSLYYSNSTSYRVQKGSNTSGVIVGLFRTSPTFDIGNGLSGKDAINDESTFVLGDGSQRAYRPKTYDSPVWSVNKNPTEDEVNRIIGNATLAYKIFSGLSFTTKIGIDHYDEFRFSAFDVYSNKPEGKLGEINEVFTRYNGFNTDSYVSFKFLQHTPLKVNGVLGHNYFSQTKNTSYLHGSSLRVPGFLIISNARNVQGRRDIQSKKVVGIYSDINIVYRDYLILNLAGRNDWSSTLPLDHNTFFYPSLGLAFVVSELLQPDNSVISYFKLRSAIGVLGSDAPPFVTDNYYQATEISGDPFIRSYSFPTLGTTAKESGLTAANKNIRAEKTTTIEIGADLELAKKAYLNVTLYNKVTSDQILPVQISGTTGYTDWIVNSGRIRNRGIELDIGANFFEDREVSWSSRLNFTKNENMVLELYSGLSSYVLGGTASTQSRAIEGQPYGVIFGSRFMRTEDGDLIIGDDGFPLINPELGVIGDPNPDWMIGVSNTLTYKNWSLTTLIDIRHGGDMWNGTQAVLDNFGMSQKTAEQRNIRGYVFDGVMMHNDGNYTENTIPVDFANPSKGLSSYKWQQYGLAGVGEEYIQDASWIRLRDVNLTYNLNEKIISKSPFQSVTLTFIAHNLFLITSYQGIDPETNLLGNTNGFGLDFFNNPNTRSFGLNLNIGF